MKKGERESENEKKGERESENEKKGEREKARTRRKERERKYMDECGGKEINLYLLSKSTSLLSKPHTMYI